MDDICMLKVSLVLILVPEGFSNAFCYCLAVKNEAFCDGRLNIGNTARIN